MTQASKIVLNERLSNEVIILLGVVWSLVCGPAFQPASLYLSSLASTFFCATLSLALAIWSAYITCARAISPSARSR